MSQSSANTPPEPPNNELPLASVITVVLNGRDTLERTICSVVNQSYPRVEYVIIDGGSRDGTLEIIDKYREKIHHVISEPDRGLYDAMNKGIANSSGDFLWFINSGDEIATPNTLAEVFKNNHTADIYYGQSLIVDFLGNTIGHRRLSPPETLTWRHLRRGMLVSHQSVIVSRAVCSNYDLRYRFSSDYDWLLRALKSSDLVVNTRMVLSRFLDGGVTKQNIRRGLVERFHVMTNNFGLVPTILYHIPIAFRFTWFVIRYRRY